ncbi:hypothetical protein HDU82_001853, partial [Entophlyctis luteolus]
MLCAATITAVECALLYFGFTASEIVCAGSLAGLGVTEQCVWSVLDQLHAVVLSFVHIVFYVLLNCCVQDSMKTTHEVAIPECMTVMFVGTETWASEERFHN